jgi:hypothetical protein
MITKRMHTCGPFRHTPHVSTTSRTMMNATLTIQDMIERLDQQSRTWRKYRINRPGQKGKIK